MLEKEVVNLNKALNQNTTPSLAIIGGAKISSKIEVLYSLMNSVDKIIIGGGMAYTFIYALGGKIGSSLFEDDKVSAAKKILTAAKEKGLKFCYQQIRLTLPASPTKYLQQLIFLISLTVQWGLILVQKALLYLKKKFI